MSELIYRNGFQYLFAGACYKPLIDFGVLLLPGAAKYDVVIMMMRNFDLTKLLQSIHHTHPGKLYAFLDSKDVHTKDADFKQYKLNVFVENLKQYNQRQSYLGDVYKRIEKAVSSDFTEIFRSIAKVKCLILISDSPLDEDKIQRIQTTSKDEFYLVNFVFDQSKVQENNDLLSGNKKSIVFAFNEVDQFLTTLTEKKMKERC